MKEQEWVRRHGKRGDGTLCNEETEQAEMALQPTTNWLNI
jgi:hypothetical protein